MEYIQLRIILKMNAEYSDDEQQPIHASTGEGY